MWLMIPTVWKQISTPKIKLTVLVQVFLNSVTYTFGAMVFTYLN